MINSVRRSRGASPAAAGAFTPWRKDFLVAGMLGAMAAYALWRALASGQLRTASIGVLVAAGLAASARWAWRNGRRRWHGKAVESWAIERIGQLLDREQLAWHAGVRVHGMGDADLLVQTMQGWVVVEIKSFERWRHGLFRRGKREHGALVQAEAVRSEIGAASAVVWLPRGRPSLWQHFVGAGGANVQVVFGDAPCLMRYLRR